MTTVHCAVHCGCALCTVCCSLSTLHCVCVRVCLCVCGKVESVGWDVWALYVYLLRSRCVADFITPSSSYLCATLTSCTSRRILLPFYGSCKYAWKVKLIICEKKNVQFCRRILSQMWDLGSKTAKALSVNLVISWEASILDINAVALPYCIAISCHISPYIAILYISQCCHIVYLAFFTWKE